MPISTQDLIKKVGLPTAIPQGNSMPSAIPGINPTPGATDNQPKTVTLADLVSRVNPANKPAPVVEKPGFFQSVIQDIAHPFLKTVISPIALVKGINDFSKGDYNAANNDVKKEYDFGYFGKVKPLGADIAPGASTGQTLLQGGKEVLGTALEMGSNFIGGEGAVGLGKSLLKSELKRAVVGGVVEGAKIGSMGAAGRSLQDNQTLGETAVNTAIGAGAGAAGGALLGVTGVGLKSILTPLSTVTQKIAPALENMAAGIEKIVLKDTKADRAAGFSAANVLKHDLGGTVKDTIEKATAKLKDLRQQAIDMRAGATKAISLNEIVQQTANDVLDNRIGSFGVNKKMETAMADFVKEMEYISPDGKITVPQAQEVKEALGTFGSWLYGNRDLDSTAQERVANIMYSKIKTAIEKNSPKELAGINKQMSEIIPIKNVAIRRLPVAERNNAIGLGDILSAGVALHNPSGWGLMIANRLQKSGTFAQNLYKGAGTLRAGAENLSTKMKGLRITPETLLNRNALLRKQAADTITTGVAKDTNLKVAQEIIPKVKATLSPKPIGNKSIPIPKEVLNKRMPIKETVVVAPKLRTQTGSEELAFQRAPKLSVKDRATETKAIKKFVTKKQQMIDEYIATNGKVANADEARKLFSDVGYKGHNSAAVQEPSSALNKEVFRKLLKDNPEPFVTIYAGGSGAGKSSAIKGQKAIQAAETKSAAILDGNLSSLKSAEARLQEILDAGKTPKFVYVYRDPIDAFENGVVKRMNNNIIEGGRIVPAKIVAGNHKDSLAVIKKLYEESPAKLRKNFIFLDNSLGKGKVKKMTYQELLQKKIPKDLEKTLINKSQQLYDQGQLTKKQLAKYIE